MPLHVTQQELLVVQSSLLFLRIAQACVLLISLRFFLLQFLGIEFIWYNGCLDWFFEREDEIEVMILSCSWESRFDLKSWVEHIYFSINDWTSMVIWVCCVWKLMTCGCLILRDIWLKQYGYLLLVVVEFFSRWHYCMIYHGLSNSVEFWSSTI